MKKKETHKREFTFNLIYFFLKVSYENIRFDKRGFFIGLLKLKNHLENIGNVFLKGYHISLLNKNYDFICQQLNKENIIFKGFGFEGAAMAKTIINTISLFKKDRLGDFIRHSEGEKHIYMLHVGIGWGYARLPVNIERKIESFDPLLRWLIIDGYGFHQAYFKTKKYVYEKTAPNNLKNTYSKHVFYQGLGRCLWFIEGADPQRIANRIQSFPEIYHQDLWAGIGLACAYAGGVGENDIQEIRNLSGQYYLHLMQGVAFAAKTRQRAENMVEHTEMACKIICGIHADKVSLITDKCLDGIPSNLSSQEKYAFWKSSIMNELSNQQKTNEKIDNHLYS